MTDAEAKLMAAWRAEAPPARDGAFRLAVMTRLARRRLHERMLGVGLFGVAAMILAWSYAPQLNAMVAGQPEMLAMVISACALGWAAFTLAPVMRRFF